MKRFHQAIGVLLIALLGAWGCAKSPTNTGSVERIKALETKSARLEEDFRSVSAARDQLKKRLVVSEELQAQLVAEAQRLRSEYDKMEQQLRERTTQRDVVQSEYDLFRKNLGEMLRKAEVSLEETMNQPVRVRTIPVIPVNASSSTNETGPILNPNGS